MAKPHIPLPTVCAALLAALCAASEVPSTVVTTADDVVDPEDGVVSLREAVAYAGTGTLGNTITLTNDVMLIEPLVLTKSVIINGIPGRDRECAVTINSLSEFSGESAFVIPSTSLVMFNDLTLYGGVGRAIENAGDLRLRNITIDNNYGGADIGGGIYNTGTLFVSNAVVSFSSAFSGGGLYNAGAATIVDTVFDFCTAGGDVDAPPVGGAIRNTGTLVVRNCLFFGCDASGDEALPGRGGAIHNTGRAVIDGATFTGMNGDGGGTGKADVWNAPGGDLQINNSTFFFETSDDWCPPVTGFVRNESGASLALLNSSFAATGPIAATSTNTYRFVVIDSAPAKALVLNCAFTETQADAVFGAANATVRGCAYGRALGTVFQTRVETYNDPPWENTDLRRCISGSFLQICPYPVAGLAAAQPGVRLRNADGALQWLDGSVWTDANVMLPNLPDDSLAADLFGIERAPDAQGRIFPGAGASPHGQESVSAIVTTTEDIVDPYDGLVSFREAAVYGFYKNYFDFMGGHSDYIEFSPDLHNQDIVVTNGPVRIDGNGANITVSGPVRLVAPNGGRILELFNMQSCSLEQGLVFADATSDGDCGALYAQGIGQLYVNAATFTNCVAAGSGGAIWFDGGELNLSYCRFQGCRSTGGSGGAVFTASGSGATKIHRARFEGCSAAGAGGAIRAPYIENYACEFRNNRAHDGGAVSADGGIIDIALFIDNAATGRGGAITTGPFLFQRVTFIENSAPRGAAAFLTAGTGKTAFLNSSFLDNAATDATSGAVESLHPVRFGNCVDWNNTAAGSLAFTVSSMGADIVAINSLLADQPAGTVRTGGLSTVDFAANPSAGFLCNSSDGLPKRYEFFCPSENGGMPGAFSSLHTSLRAAPALGGGTKIGTIDNELYYESPDDSLWYDVYGNATTGSVTVCDVDQAGYSRFSWTWYGYGTVTANVHDPYSLVVTGHGTVADNDDGVNTLYEAVQAACKFAESGLMSDNGTYRITFDFGADPDRTVEYGYPLRPSYMDRFTDGVRLVIDGDCGDGTFVTLDLGGELRLYGDFATAVWPDCDIEFRNLRIIDGTAPCGPNSGETAYVGGGIAFFATNGRLTFENCEFDNCGTGQMFKGGAIYSQSDVVLRGCTFRGCNAPIGGAVCVEGAHLTMENCLFEGNTAADSIVTAPAADLFGCTFRDNTFCAAVLLLDGAGTSTLANASFLDNHWTSTYSGTSVWAGGGEWTAGYVVQGRGTDSSHRAILDIGNTISAGNIATGFLKNQNATVRVLNSAIAEPLSGASREGTVVSSSSSATTVTGMVGTVAHAISALDADVANPGTPVGFYTLSGAPRLCWWDGQTWRGVGSSAVSSADVELIATDILGKPRTLGGAGYPFYTCGALSDSAIDLVVTTAADTVNALDGVTSLREAVAAAEGGVTRLDGSKLISFSIPGVRNPVIQLASPIIVSNEVAFTARSPLYISGVHGSGHATLSGGGATSLFRVYGGSHLAIADCTLADGDSDFGGAIRSDGGLLLAQTTFSGCSARLGGAIYAADVEASNCTFTNCVSGNSGGAVFVMEYGTFLASNCAFVDNVAYPSGDGGAIYAAPKSFVAVERATFLGNSASDGSAVYADNQSVVTLSNATFAQNTAEYSFCAVISGLGAWLDVSFVTSWGNTSDEFTVSFLEQWAGSASISDSLIAEAAPDAITAATDSDTIFSAMARNFECQNGIPELRGATVSGVRHAFFMPSAVSVSTASFTGEADQLGAARTVGAGGKSALGAIDLDTVIPPDPTLVDEPTMLRITAFALEGDVATLTIVSDLTDEQFQNWLEVATMSVVYHEQLGDATQLPLSFTRVGATFTVQLPAGSSSGFLTVVGQ